MRSIFFSLLLLTSASLTFAQNNNQAAVDTLTKDVAIAVFEKINQPKAQEIYGQLLDCGDGCDPQQVIRGVGSWDQVGAKMQELNELKNTARFISLSPEEANTAIRKQLADFYNRYKNDNNYGKPLSPAVQTQILAKIDQLLPPATPLESTPVVSENASTSGTASDEGAAIDPTAYRISQLESQAKKAEEKQLWMMIGGLIIGLLIGAGAVYLLAYRALKNEVDRLTDDNTKLARQNDGLRNKPVNEPRQPQPDYRQKVSAYDAIVSELGTDNPIGAIRELKQQTKGTGSVSAIVRSGELTVESVTPPESKPKDHPQAPLPPLPPLEPLPPLTQSEVFYFPPPDPTGQFDLSQKSGSLSPESAYRFSVTANNPAVASFRFEAEPGRVARFLTYRNYMIEPACDSENSYSNAYTRIVNRQDGEAILENGVWRVKNKALVRYE